MDNPTYRLSGLIVVILGHINVLPGTDGRGMVIKTASGKQQDTAMARFLTPFDTSPWPDHTAGTFASLRRWQGGGEGFSPWLVEMAVLLGWCRDPDLPRCGT